MKPAAWLALVAALFLAAGQAAAQDVDIT